MLEAIAKSIKALWYGSPKKSWQEEYDEAKNPSATPPSNDMTVWAQAAPPAIKPGPFVRPVNPLKPVPEPEPEIIKPTLCKKIARYRHQAHERRWGRSFVGCYELEEMQKEYAELFVPIFQMVRERAAGNARLLVENIGEQEMRSKLLHNLELTETATFFPREDNDDSMSNALAFHLLHYKTASHEAGADEPRDDLAYSELLVAHGLMIVDELFDHYHSCGHVPAAVTKRHIKLPTRKRKNVKSRNCCCCPQHG